jgi:hypothetical protein
VFVHGTYFVGRSGLHAYQIPLIGENKYWLDLSVVRAKNGQQLLNPQTFE